MADSSNITSTTFVDIAYGAYNDLITYNNTVGQIRFSTDIPSLWLDNVRIDANGRLDSAVETINQDISYLEQTIIENERVTAILANDLNDRIKAFEEGGYATEAYVETALENTVESIVTDNTFADVVGTAYVGVTKNDNHTTTLSFSYLKGNQGYRGYQGYQGYRGFQGYQGYRGFQGYQGEQGYRGFQGYQGYRGFQGYQGDQGYRGYQGYQGYRGFQGYQGSDGTQGYRGFQGYRGYQGEQGYRGYQGEQGYRGYQGYQGADGTQGYRGFQGYQGYQGEQGYRGFQGYQGYQGDQGYQGYRGFQGYQGESGLTADIVSTDVQGLAPQINATNQKSIIGVETTSYYVLAYNGVQQTAYWYNGIVSKEYVDSEIELLSTQLSDAEKVTAIVANDLNKRIKVFEDGSYITSYNINDIIDI